LFWRVALFSRTAWSYMDLKLRLHSSHVRRRAFVFVPGPNLNHVCNKPLATCGSGAGPDTDRGTTTAPQSTPSPAHIKHTHYHQPGDSAPTQQPKTRRRWRLHRTLTLTAHSPHTHRTLTTEAVWRGRREAEEALPSSCREAYERRSRPSCNHSSSCAGHRSPYRAPHAAATLPPLARHSAPGCCCSMG